MPAIVSPSLVNNGVMVAVPAGVVSNPILLSGDTTIAAIPGAGGTMLVEASYSRPEEVNAGTANWFPWDGGAVSAAANQRLLGASAVRFTATTAAGVGEIGPVSRSLGYQR